MRYVFDCGNLLRKIFEMGTVLEFVNLYFEPELTLQSVIRVHDKPHQGRGAGEDGRDCMVCLVLQRGCNVALGVWKATHIDQCGVPGVPRQSGWINGCETPGDTSRAYEQPGPNARWNIADADGGRKPRMLPSLWRRMTPYNQDRMP